MIINDAHQERTETFSLTLSNASTGAMLDTQQHGNDPNHGRRRDDRPTNPIDTRDFFVRQQCRDFLNRDC